MMVPEKAEETVQRIKKSRTRYSELIKDVKDKVLSEIHEVETRIHQYLDSQ